MRREKNKQHNTGSRRNARELAFRVIFEAEQGNLDLDNTFARVLAQSHDEADEVYTALSEDVLQLTRDIVTKYQNHKTDIDEALQTHLSGWTFGQMLQTDVNILRIAAAEILYLGTDAPIVIESAIRMARKFGTEESGRFVNSILDKLFKSGRTA